MIRLLYYSQGSAGGSITLLKSSVSRRDALYATLLGRVVGVLGHGVGFDSCCTFGDLSSSFEVSYALFEKGRYDTAEIGKPDAHNYPTVCKHIK